MKITDEMRDARLNCPVGGCVGTVRLFDYASDYPVWECDNCQSEWHVDGTPRWAIETPVDIDLLPGEAQP